MNYRVVKKDYINQKQSLFRKKDIDGFSQLKQNKIEYCELLI